MSYFAVKDANGDIIYVAATGAGTTGDPYVPTRTFTNSIPAGTAVIGKVDQGTGGASAWKVDGSGVTQPVSAASLPLPAGAATAANQTTANASLGSIDGKLPAAAAAEHITAASPHAARLSDGSAFYKATTPSDTQPVTLQAATSGGASVYRNIDLGSTGQVVKNAAGQLYGWYISNNASANRFVKIYDKATAATSSDTPVFTLQIPASAAANVAFPNGVAFANGISARATTGVADNDTGAPTTNDVIVNLSYK